ncbi:MAG: TonB-dependent receptor [Bacteroidetes bacterium]|nr:TonB-dependent receptor [Bacteroidota bacterium]
MQVKGWALLVFNLISIGLVWGQIDLNQKVNLHAAKLNQSEALQLLSENTGLGISFSSNFFDRQITRDYHFKDLALGKALEQILEGSNLSFKPLGDQIIIFKSRSILISGFIVDAENGEFLVNASIYDQVQNVGITTNEYGFFSISVLSDSYSLVASYVGYKAANIAPNGLSTKEDLRIELERDDILAEVEVRATPNAALLARDANQSIDLQNSLLKLSPSLGGTEDYLRSAQLLPGVNGGIDGFGGLQVRGGDAGQNMMLLDGVTVFLPYHLLGAFSVYNPQTVNSAKLIQGAFPARYGGRVASIFDVRTREGNQENWQSHFSLNLINANAVVEGPIAEGKGALLIAARYSPSGALFNPFFKNTIFQNDELSVNSNFYDLNLKLNYKLGLKDRLYLSVFNGRDQLANSFSDTLDLEVLESETNFNWNNTIASLRWNHIYNKSLFSNSTLTFSDYGFELNSFELNAFTNGDFDDFYLYTNLARNSELGLSSDFDYYHSNRLHFRFGGSASRSLFNLELSFIDDEDADTEDLEDIDLDALGALSIPVEMAAYQAQLYAESIWKWSPSWEANFGLRLSSFYSDGQAYFNPEPRLALTYRPNAKSLWQASATRMIQYIHLISSTALRLPSDLWLPSSKNIKPQDAWQGELTYEYALGKGLSFRSSAYIRNISNMQAYVDSTSYLEDIEEDSTQSFLTGGSGRSIGWESSLNYQGARNGFMLSYTLSQANRRFDAHNLGQVYPFDFDQRHQVKVFAYQAYKDWSISFNWLYFSPNPRISFIALEGSEISRVELNELGRKNELRGEAYHRLDISLSYKFKIKGSRHRLKLGAYNVYNRDNVALYEVDDENGIFQSFPIGSLGFLPSFYYSLQF